VASPLLAPQLIKDSRMLYFGWVPADREAVAALVPAGLAPAENHAVYINQYVVDRPEQTSGFGAYSLTYLGVDLAGLDLADGTPGRWWTHYFNSSPGMREYAAERGLPAEPGETALAIEGDVLTATTSAGGAPLIRTRARVGATSPAVVARGQLRYITKVGGRLMQGQYPYVLDPVDQFELLSLEFLRPGHPVNALAPASPLQVTQGFYSPRVTFCYPGGEGPL
jgi:hypothetical protein